MPTDDGQILVTFADDLYVDDDMYVLSIDLAEKLATQFEEILAEVRRN